MLCFSLSLHILWQFELREREVGSAGKLCGHQMLKLKSILDRLYGMRVTRQELNAYLEHRGSLGLKC